MAHRNISIQILTAYFTCVNHSNITEHMWKDIVENKNILFHSVFFEFINCFVVINHLHHTIIFWGHEITPVQVYTIFRGGPSTRVHHI